MLVAFSTILCRFLSTSDLVSRKAFSLDTNRIYTSNNSKWWRRSAPLVNLTTRICHRATTLVLESFVERAKADLRAPQGSVPTKVDAAAPGSEFFVQLHSRYMATMRTHALGGEIFTVFVTTLYPVANVLGMIINMVSVRKTSEHVQGSDGFPGLRLVRHAVVCPLFGIVVLWFNDHFDSIARTKQSNYYHYVALCRCRERPPKSARGG